MLCSTGTILFVAIAAKPASLLFELDGLPSAVANMITGISSNRIVIMFILYAFLICVGMFMDATAAIFILVPILLPAVQAVGVSPLFFVVFLVITLSFGLITPPVGVCLYAAQNVTDLPLEKIIKASNSMDCTDCNCIMYIHYIPWNYNDTCKIDIRKLIRRKSYENCSIRWIYRKPWRSQLELDRKFGEVEIYDRTAYEDSPLIVERIGDAEIVIVNKTPITKDTINKCQNIKLIAVLATGYNVIDYEYAKEKGIMVVNVPTYGTQIVGQYAVGLLMEICSHYGYHAETVKNGKWANNPDWCYWDYPMIELYGKTAGIIGLGRIGQATAKILNALDMNVIAYDAYQSEAGKKVAEYVELDELLAKSDVIFLHCPLFPETDGIINKENIAKMKDGVILINNSRGQLVVEQDLADALNEGKVYAAGLDVVSTEPIREDNPLINAKNCLITPHISWAAKESRQRIMDITENNIEQFLRGDPVNVVNK